jgi:DNA-binding NtrC family response regulator
MKKHILSVDDEPNIRALLQEVLTGKGYRVSTAAEQEQANWIVKEDPPQLIIIDFQIEQGDGFTTIEALKKLMPTTPILLLTGVIFDHQVVRDTIQKKVDSYLNKTVSLNMIISEVQRLLGDPQDTLIGA